MKGSSETVKNKQISSFNNNKHICEYQNNDMKGINNYFNSYQDNKRKWENTPFNDKKDIFLKTVDLIENKYYDKMMEGILY